ncbi:DUF421 domain-containing protein [Janibacter sp. CX7]|uniref:DUF421 domain-containing protein n=1 Tax=Janibacter sp. CX7 TaxID=2963431 RepID=UPI0020CEDDD1|nr:YetF domain-containing protein [Janibacter sp. CX7]UTT67472.1 DUF421 domain-containing protein [Janibacter sp. CX7]
MTTILGAAAVFLVLMVVLRVMGKRELSQMTAFELVMLFVIGDIVAEAVISEDTSLVGALVATATFAVLTVLLSWLSYRWAPARPVVDGVPCIVLIDGAPDERVMRRERVTVDDLAEAARAQGIKDLAEIRLGLLEPNGSFSFFERSGR